MFLVEKVIKPALNFLLCFGICTNRFAKYIGQWSISQRKTEYYARASNFLKSKHIQKSNRIVEPFSSRADYLPYFFILSFVVFLYCLCDILL